MVRTGKEYLKEQLLLIKKQITVFNPETLAKRIDETRLPEIADVINGREETALETLQKTKAFWEEKMCILFEMLEENPNLSPIQIFLTTQSDPVIWCALWLRFKNRPFLMFPNQWEIFRSYLDNDCVWTFCCRQTGKTAVLVAVEVYEFFLKSEYPNTGMILSPSEKQDYLYRRTWENVQRLSELDFIHKYYFQQETSKVKKDDFNNDIDNKCWRRGANLMKEGELLLGESPDKISMDEIQRYPKNFHIEIIQPMLASQFSDSRIRMIGTPHTKWNKELEDDWLSWVEDPDLCTNRLSWEQSVCEGLTKINEVEKAIISLRKYGGIHSDEFKMWWCALFPSHETHFYKPEYFMRAFNAAIQADNDLILPRNILPEADWRAPKAEYVMALDFGGHKDRFEAVVGRYTPEMDEDGIMRKRMHVVFWYEANPQDKCSINKQVWIAKRLFWNFDCTLVYPDGNRTEVMWLDKREEDGLKGIPRSRIYCNESAKKRETLGVYLPNEIEKEKLHKNMRQQLMFTRFIPPRSSDFFANWQGQFLSLDIRDIDRGRGHMLFKKGKGGDDLAMCTVYLALHMADKINRTGASMRMMVMEMKM